MAGRSLPFIWVGACLFLATIAGRQPVAWGGEAPVPAASERSSADQDRGSPKNDLVPAHDRILQYVTSRYVAAVVIRPDALLGSTHIRAMPTELLLKSVVGPLPVSQDNVEEVVLLFGLDWSFDPLLSAVCRFKQPFDRNELVAHLEPTESQPNVPPFFRCRGGALDGLSAAMPDERTIVFALSDAELTDLISGKRPAGPLAKHLRSLDRQVAVAAVCTTAVLRTLQFALMDESDPLSADVEELASITDLVSIIELSLRLDPLAEVCLGLQMNEADAATDVERLIDHAFSLATRSLEAAVAAAADSDAKPESVAQLRYYQRLVSQLVASIERRHEDRRLVLRIDGPDVVAASIGALTAYCVDAMDVSDSSATDARAKAEENLRRIGQAELAYRQLHHKRPTSSTDQAGKPLLSWRVHLLPFLDEQDLYERFHLDEPWDSEHNRPLLAEMPEVYRSAGFPEEDKTNFQMVAARGAASSDAAGSTDDMENDGEVNAILVVAANQARTAAWTKPDDFKFDEADIFAGLGGLYTGGFLALFSDGTVNFVEFSTDPAQVRSLFLPKANAVEE